MSAFTLDALHTFIVRAKAATYVGGGAHSLSSRPGSHDLQFHAPPFGYLDSYFGGADFVGQEVVFFEGKPVWAMNYYGRLLDASHLSAAEAGQVIQASLAALYREGRFLGGFEYTRGDLTYVDTNQGDVTSFSGREWIARQGPALYELLYHGGLIRD